MLKKVKKYLSKKILHTQSFETYFNVPIKFDNKNNWTMNERIVEWGYVFSQIRNTSPLKILDFGCSRGWIALSLASMGHKVVGVDLRNFPFSHPNFKFLKKNILNLEENNFDIILSLSTLEHVGLGAYNESVDENAFTNVLKKFYSLLKINGQLILTLPVGKPSIDSFERSFAPDKIKDLLKINKLFLSSESYFQKNQERWTPVSEDIIKNVDNDASHRTNGVNGIGCLTFKKVS